MPPCFHGLGHDMQRQGGLAGGFRTVDLHNPAARHTAHSQGHVQGDRTGGDGLHTRQRLIVAQAHDGALAELFLDLAQRQLNRLVFFLRGIFFRHAVYLLEGGMVGLKG